MPDIYLLLGSNLGDRETYLENSRKLLAEQLGPITGVSSLYRTAAWGNEDQPDFINQVVRVVSDLPPSEVLRVVLEIEKTLGRVREEKWGSRIIDIDILFYGDQIVNEKDLVIPHPLLHERRFTVEPLAELAPSLVHPVLNKSIKSIFESLRDNLVVHRLN